MKNLHIIFLTVLFFTVASGNFNNTCGNQGYAELPDFNVVPPAYLSTPGTSTFLGPLSASPRSYQLLIHEDQLTALLGTHIKAITFRIPVSATSDWPVSDVLFSNFDVFLSGSVDPVNRSLTFVNNVVGEQKQVRSGSLTITANAFTSGGSPNNFGTDINFDSLYFYSGGNLLIELRHTGFTGTSRSVDAIGTSISGYGTQFSALWQSSYTPTTGLQGNFAVTRINSELLVGINNNSGIPDNYYLNQNYPNPFNPKTLIKYNLAKSGNVVLKVYDIIGNEIETLVNEKQNAGIYEVGFDGRNLSSGIYIAKLTADNFTSQIKMILNK
ncbi:MAG: T9SS type A sorting domain-containing protein [Bacteroidetes bacterium]|nr:T9SS type A sorting domain-containing protein [Bacteroidota bacterium]